MKCVRDVPKLLDIPMFEAREYREIGADFNKRRIIVYFECFEYGTGLDSRLASASGLHVHSSELLILRWQIYRSKN